MYYIWLFTKVAANHWFSHIKFYDVKYSNFLNDKPFDLSYEKKQFMSSMRALVRVVGMFLLPHNRWCFSNGVPTKICRFTLFCLNLPDFFSNPFIIVWFPWSFLIFFQVWILGQTTLCFCPIWSNKEEFIQIFRLWKGALQVVDNRRIISK